MKIVKNTLVQVDSSDVKKGVLRLPESVKKIDDEVCLCLDILEKVIAPNLTQIGNDNFRLCNALTTFEAPVLTQIGNYNFRLCNALTTFEAPVLTQICNDNFHECNALTRIKIGENNLNVKCVDGYTFVIESEKTTKGIKIYTGFNLKGTDSKGKLYNEKIYIAEKEGFFAHGSTIKLAISDVHFKIIAEKIKKEPINEDTEISVMYYRTVTGACDLGCREFMKANNIPFKVENEKTIEETTIKAKDLIVLLEKSNAYGLSKFKELLNF